MGILTAFRECQSLQISLKKDWFQLSTGEKITILDMAKDHNYKDPKHHAGRSKGYMFYLALQRKQTKWEQNK